MKNDGHGHLARIPSLFISNTDGLILKSKECSESPVVKIKFKIEQAEVSHVIFWLDVANVMVLLCREKVIFLRGISIKMTISKCYRNTLNLI